MNMKIISSGLLVLALWTPLGVWAAGDNTNTEESCLATFSVSDQTLTLPCVEVVMGNETVLYSAQLQQVGEGSFALTQVAEASAVVESECVASYSLETGELGVPCVEVVNPPWETESQGMRLQALEPSTPKMFVISDRTSMSQLRSIASDEGTSEVSQEDTKKASLGVLKYLQENGLINLPPDTEVDYLESYLNQKGLKLNIVVLKPAGFLILSSDYSHDVIIDFSAQKWEAHFGYLDVFTGRDDRPEIYKNKWKLFIEQGSEGLRHREVRSGDDCAVGEECRHLYTVGWDQNDRLNGNSVDYNSEMPYGPSGIKTSNGKCYAGCVAVAMGQVMNYHKYPSYSPLSGIRYNWSDVLFDTSLATLLKELNQKGQALASCDITGTGMTRGDMLDTLRTYGYTIDSSDNHTADGMYSFAKRYIDQNRPVLLWGRKWDVLSIFGYDVVTRGFNHTVVVEGYKKVTGYLSNDYYLYINYGWGGYGNRWWGINSLADWVWSDRLGTKSLDALIPPLPSSNYGISYFDGAGSLINSSQDCDGCNRDVAKMYSHNGPSTVVFQWKKDSNCDHIDIEASPGIGEVVIQSRSWSSSANTLAYRGYLPLSVPQQGPWNITAVTSISPLSQNAYVYAKCKSSYESLTSGTSLPTGLVKFDFDYYWSGNGSLISRAGTGVGKTEDLAITFPDRKSLTVFQWYASESCSGVSISDKGGNAVMLTGVQNEVALKLWDADGWKSTNCSSIPCFITVPKLNDVPQLNKYYLIKIKTDPGAVSSGQLKMSCF